MGARALIFGCCEEMLSKIVFGRNQSSAATKMPDDGDERDHEGKEAENRDGKKNMHACLERITRCMDFVQLIRLERRFDDLCGAAIARYMN